MPFLLYKVELSGALGIILALVGAILTITAAVSWCPIYAALGLSTFKKTQEEN